MAGNLPIKFNTLTPQTQPKLPQSGMQNMTLPPVSVPMQSVFTPFPIVRMNKDIDLSSVFNQNELKETSLTITKATEISPENTYETAEKLYSLPHINNDFQKIADIISLYPKVSIFEILEKLHKIEGTRQRCFTQSFHRETWENVDINSGKTVSEISLIEQGKYSEIEFIKYNPEEENSSNRLIYKISREFNNGELNEEDEKILIDTGKNWAGKDLTKHSGKVWLIRQKSYNNSKLTSVYDYIEFPNWDTYDENIYSTRYMRGPIGIFNILSKITGEKATGYYDIVSATGEIISKDKGFSTDTAKNTYRNIITKDGFIHIYYPHNVMDRQPFRIVQENSEGTTYAKLVNNKWEITSKDKKSGKVKLKQFSIQEDDKITDVCETENITRKIIHKGSEKTETSLIIKDDEGKEIINSDFEIEVKDNSFVTRKNLNGKTDTYKISIKGDEIIAEKTNSEGKKEVIKKKMNAFTEKPFLLKNLLKTTCGETIYEMLLNNIYLSSNDYNNTCSRNEISLKDNDNMSFALNHEFGHSIDWNEMICENKDLIEIYKQELLKVDPNDKTYILYFSDLSYAARTGLNELIAEVFAMLNSTQLEYADSIRTAKLQQYFPKTTAKIIETHYNLQK